ncbi:hypothetical protein [Umezawaea sp. Da 62-37]|uniref:hypothetical protein n=1 Tax=Umezawaea sp. Da 62-37 TaxID=3075927 RepID=UPI0028F6D4A9|nr:hypothetical protein [Umezawaea sp. Da 62-37]WNV84660.1 hypothetical protein RM788_41920 [Umezawaea sp. Da 62-37]
MPASPRKVAMRVWRTLCASTKNRIGATPGTMGVRGSFGLLDSGLPTWIVKQILPCLDKPRVIVFPDFTPEAIAILESSRSRDAPRPPRTPRPGSRRSRVRRDPGRRCADQDEVWGQLPRNSAISRLEEGVGQRNCS